MMLLLLGIAIHSTFLKWKNDISRRPKKIHRNRPPSIGAGCGRLGSSHYGMAYHPSSALETPHQFSALDGNKSTSQPKKCPFWGGNKSLDCGWRSWFIYIYMMWKNTPDEWRAKNPDKVYTQWAEYYEENKPDILSRNRECRKTYNLIEVDCGVCECKVKKCRWSKHILTTERLQNLEVKSWNGF